jgi:hypothetical protein
MALTRIQPPAVADVREPNFRNIIINGDMAVSQRATSAASVASNGYHACDRWRYAESSSAVVTISQDTDVPTGQGFASSFKIDCTTADASLGAAEYVLLQQKFEGQNLQYLKKGTSSAQSLTLSFWVKSTKTGTFIAMLYDRDNTRQIAKSYTVSVSDTWEQKTITYAGDTTGALDNDNAASLELWLWLGVGSNYSSGSLSTSWATETAANQAVGQVNAVDSTSNNFLITGVQLEAGSVATDFEVVSYPQNLRRCQRYYLLVVDGAGSFGTGCSITTSQFLPIVDHPVTMRANPTLSYASGSYYAVNQTGGNITVDTLALNQQNVNQTMFTMSNATFTRAGDSGVAFCLTSDAFIGLAAEL